jgi:hypothetical protein
MSRRTQFTLPDRQYELLRAESLRSSVSMAELVRRAIDTAYQPGRRPTLRGYELSLGVWRQPDAAVAWRLEPRGGRSPLDD